MSDRMFNLLEEAIITAAPLGPLTLPGTLAALARDAVDDFPALRAHQGMFWHMFLVQLAALALHRASETEIPEDEDSWRRLLRGLTADFPDDEPWCLVVDDWSKPAFMQAAVPDGVKLDKPIPSPDALDLLITAKNHDLKQAVARRAEPEDWLFALVTQQTGGTRDVQNSSTVRTGNSNAPRICMSLAPYSARCEYAQFPRLGSWFSRSVVRLIESRKDNEAFCEVGGLGLTWLSEWPKDKPIQTKELDIWFIEICRRARLSNTEKLHALSRSDKSGLIDTQPLKGQSFDPWTPTHKTQGRLFALSSKGFHYKVIVRLLFGERRKGEDVHDWVLPPLLELGKSDTETRTLLIVAQGVAGNPGVKTGSIGFYSRIVPLSGRVSRALGPRRAELHQLAQAQVEIIAEFDRALRNALVLAAAGGEQDRVQRDLYKHSEPARAHLDRYADEIFFEHLWARFEAQEAGTDALRKAEKAFAAKLW
ncbi:CRISPR-associated protein Cse1 [Chelativorans sp. Marseille-P2723]|uniref:CRISPR-associated protein Cse1 n=1 Tax=Chelativorans sp. Marseille-P2723 TaxID=2709133 RepID=UPI00156DD473|nr:CRISPR-associated protein Cse1 [Chelativorans sp. Marseille-P2723]